MLFARTFPGEELDGHLNPEIHGVIDLGRTKRLWLSRHYK